MLRKNTKRPICQSCKIRPARKCRTSTMGFTTWRKFCSSCDSKKYRKKIIKSNQCTSCNFIAEHPCQLDLVKLSDGYKTYCANCNRLRIQNLKQKAHDEFQLTVDATVDISQITI
jgi:hypothetical protein